MAKRIRCPCAGKPGCKLCSGNGFYNYEPGPDGWQMIVCPTCEGKRELPKPEAPGEMERCFTCHGAGSVDPANPPVVGFWDLMSKIFFGA